MVLEIYISRQDPFVATIREGSDQGSGMDKDQHVGQQSTGDDEVGQRSKLAREGWLMLVGSSKFHILMMAG